MSGWRGFDPNWCKMTYGRYLRTTSFAPNAREISDGIANLRRPTALQSLRVRVVG